MALSTGRTPTAGDVAALLPKFDDPDPDIRYMIMADLQKILANGQGNWLGKDYVTAARTIDVLLKALDDVNGDVQSAALSCIGPLASRSPADILAPFIDKLTSITPQKSQDTSIPATATRTLIASFPRPIPGVPVQRVTQEAYTAVSRVLIPRLLGKVVLPRPKEAGPLPDPPRGMLEFAGGKGGGSGAPDADAIDVLNETVRCFGSMLQEPEVKALGHKLVEIVATAGPGAAPGGVAAGGGAAGAAARKKAVAGMAQLAPFLTDKLLAEWVQATVKHMKAANVSPPQRRVLIAMVGAVARSIPRRIGKFLPELVPRILGALSAEELEQAQEQLGEEGAIDPALIEVKEAALIALEDLLSCCTADMEPHTDLAIDACIRHLSFDPTVIEADDEMDGAENEDDDDDANGEAEDEDFEEEDQLSDDDDSSWKIRRCAAKALHSLILTRSTDLIEDGALFDKIAPALIKRFHEREENVKLEVLAALALLVNKVRDSAPVEVVENGTSPPPDAPNSRKRRRGSSDASMYDQADERTVKPAAGARPELVALGDDIVGGVLKLLPQRSIATKQAATVLLHAYVLYRHDALEKQTNALVTQIVDTIRGKNLAAGNTTLTAGTSSFASVNSLRIETLDLVRAICATHSPQTLQPHLLQVAEALVIAIRDQYFMVSCHALHTAEAVLANMAAPTRPVQERDARKALTILLDEIAERAKSNKSELEVREAAIHALPVCLTGTSPAAQLTGPNQRREGLAILEERLKNETTRMAALNAVQRIGAKMEEPAAGSPEARWLQTVATEMADQLRKADPKVRGSSLSALRTLVSREPVVRALDTNTMRAMQTNLIPLLSSADSAPNANPAPALLIIERLQAARPRDMAAPELDAAVCQLLLHPLSPSTVDSLLVLVETIGRTGYGSSLMAAILKNVGVSGDASVVGRATGTLLVAGGASVHLGVADFVKELGSAQDDQRRCLALTILGEVALRQGAAAAPAVTPTTFVNFFQSRSETVPRAAATALGRAAAGNVQAYMPVLLPLLQTPGDAQRLSLLAVKELLQHPESVHRELMPYSEDIWQGLMRIADAEDSRAVGAECVGRLAALEPGKYLPLLQEYLSNSKDSIRSVVIQALRFVLSTSWNATLDATLRPALQPMLRTMLGDAELENRRLALTTLHAAARHRHALLVQHLPSLLPFVLKATEVDPRFVREVQMGPFKHQVDDGLETRKSAFETLLALVNTAWARLPASAVHDAVHSGLGDGAHEVKILAGLTLARLVELDPGGVARRLDLLAPRFQATLAQRAKENAVKQEVERVAEARRDALRCTVRLRDRLPAAQAAAAAAGVGGGAVASKEGGGGAVWKGYLEWVSKEFEQGLAEAAQEVKRQD